MKTLPILVSLALLLVPTSLRSAELDESVDAALLRVRDYLLSIQAEDGSWAGYVETDPRTSAFYLITCRKLQRPPDERSAGIEAYLRHSQLPDGSWEVWPGGGGDLAETRFCALALESAHTEAGLAAKAAADAWLARQPPPTEPDMFWQYFQAIAGERSWRDLPYISPRFVSFPDWFHPNLYDLSFIRISVVSIGLMQAFADEGPGAPSAPSAFQRELPELLAQERTPGFWKRLGAMVKSKFRNGFWKGMMAVSTLADRLFPPEKAQEKAIQWLLDRQEEDGSFFSASQVTAIGVMTLHSIDPVRFRDEIERGMEAMHRWQVVDETGTWQQFTDSTNWDTSSSVQLLLELGVPASAPEIRKAVSYLRSKQASNRADWSHRVPRLEPGGWAFQRYAIWYPDVDDTGMAVEALWDADPEGSMDAARRGLEWILGMQNRDGGWASWDKDDREWAQLPEAGPWLARDPSYADITGRLATVLARVVRSDDPRLKDLRRPARRALRRARRWIRKNRHGPAWLGAWFTHYLHGTAEVVEALRAMDTEVDDPLIREARDWVLSVRNPDGGWGESPRSGFVNRFVDAPSTSYHTAQALKILVHAGAADHPAATGAVRWLLEHQREDGAWIDTDFSGAGVPGLWYIRYHLVPTYMTGEILHLYREAVEGNRSDPSGWR